MYRPINTLGLPGALALAGVLCATPASAATAVDQCGPHHLTVLVENQCSYPVWVGQNSASPGVEPLLGSWGGAPACQTGSQCQSGTCSSGQCSCQSSSDCPAGAPCTGGLCATAIKFCLPQAWTSGTFWGRTGCSGSGTTLNCATGQCRVPGTLDCTGTGGSPLSPASQLEVTTTCPNGATTCNPAEVAANYDLSLVAGYNLPMTITPTAKSCSGPTCTQDLNAICPANLQVTAAPVSSGPIPCGNGFCAFGACAGGTTCVIGCNAPCTQCGLASPPAGLACDKVVGSYTSCTGCPTSTSSSLTNQNLYCVQGCDGNAMASPNQGTPTCFAQIDCPAGSTCTTTGFPKGFQPPAGMGVCINPGNPNYSNAFGQCSASTVGSPCGGYLQSYSKSQALGYTCQPVTYSQGTAYVCVPPLTQGMGTCTAPDSGSGVATLYTGVGGVFNSAWITAATTAGGGTTPFYETFHTACPKAYAWQYDDPVGGFSCTGTTGITVSFCGL